MAQIELHLYEINLLERLAKRSKMDSWFKIDDEGRVRDRENGNKVMSTRKAIKQFIEGLTPYDVDGLGDGDVINLLNLAIK